MRGRKGEVVKAKRERQKSEGEEGKSRRGWKNDSKSGGVWNREGDWRGGERTEGGT